MLTNLRKLVCASLLGLSVFGLAGSVATATDYCPPTYCPQYRWVTTCETRCVPYTVCETRYDHCNRPYTVEVTRYRTVTVHVRQYVRVN